MTITIKLTKPQAMALREMVLSSDQYNADDEPLPPAYWRALVKLENAIENCCKIEFVNRATVREAVAPQNEE